MKIEKHGKRRQLVISDIHGCSMTLKALLEDKVQISIDDQIFLLRGNHEQNILDAYDEFDKNMFAYYVGKIIMIFFYLLLHIISSFLIFCLFMPDSTFQNLTPITIK